MVDLPSPAPRVRPEAGPRTGSAGFQPSQPKKLLRRSGLAKAGLRWTASLVEERLVEAADTLKRLPEVRVQGYYSTWPAVIRDFWEAFGWHGVRVRPGPPSPAAIDRMDETLGWLRWLEPDDAKIVWLRASGKRWKSVCWEVGLQRSAAHRHWLYALSLIAWRLNGGRTPRTPSQGREILQARRVRT